MVNKHLLSTAEYGTKTFQYL